MARRVRRKKKPAYEADFGPQEQLQDKVVDKSAVFKRMRRPVECRLDWYLVRGYIDRREHRAGMEFRALWLTSVKQPRITGSYSDLRNPSTGDEVPVRILRAKAQVQSCLALLTAQESDAVVTVAGTDDWCGRGRSGFLKAGLGYLASGWGY